MSQLITPSGYGRIARLLHWVMALLLIVQWVSGEKDGWFGGPRFHFSLGLSLMLLILIRLGWRITHPAPALPAAAPAWERFAARSLHWIWYVLLIAMPLSGILWRQLRDKAISWFGLFDLPVVLTPDPELARVAKDVHEVLGTVFLVVLAIHVLAALKHHFIDRDGVLRGMLRGG